MMLAFRDQPQIIISKVDGVATAAGCQLVANSDLAIASSTSRFATPGVNIGAFCSTPGVSLGRAVGRKHAMEMLLTGEAVGAERAREMGLINRVVAPEALDGEVHALARLIASKSPAAIATGKRVFSRQLEMPLEEAYAFAGHAIAADFFGDDGRKAWTRSSASARRRGKLASSRAPPSPPCRRGALRAAPGTDAASPSARRGRRPP